MAMRSLVFHRYLKLSTTSTTLGSTVLSGTLQRALPPDLNRSMMIRLFTLPSSFSFTSSASLDTEPCLRVELALFVGRTTAKPSSTSSALACSGSSVKLL